MEASGEENKPLRDEKGRLLPGHSGNPSGTSRKYKHIRKLAESYSEEAIHTLAGIMLNDEEKAKDRIHASNSILDRAFGKPTQHIEATHQETSDKESIDRPERVSREEWLRNIIEDKKKSMKEENVEASTWPAATPH